MPFDVDVQYFRRRISLLIKGLSARFDEFASRDYPSEAPLELIALVRAILDLLLEKSQSADEKLLPLMFLLLYEYQNVLQFVDNAHTEQTPSGLASVIKDLLDKISPDSKFFASPQAIYNYSIRDLKPKLVDPLTNLLSADEKASLPEGSHRPFHLITFPRAERDNILVHAVFGHEVGHILAKKYLDQEVLTPEYSTAFQAKITKVFLDPASPPSTELRKRSQLSNAIAHLRRRALEELLSDYVGMLIFGPSCLFALYDILSLHDLDVAPCSPNFYPPNRYRLRMAYSALRDVGFIDKIETLAQSNEYLESTLTLVQRIEKLINRRDDEASIAVDPVVKVIYEWVYESIDSAAVGIKALVPADLTYSLDNFCNEVPELIERIALGVPPNELGVYPEVKIPSWQSALASAWCVKIHGQKTTEHGDRQPLTLDEHTMITRFGLRAVENIALRRDYELHQSILAEQK